MRFVNSESRQHGRYQPALDYEMDIEPSISACSVANSEVHQQRRRVQSGDWVKRKDFRTFGVACAKKIPQPQPISKLRRDSTISPQFMEMVACIIRNRRRTQ